MTQQQFPHDIEFFLLLEHPTSFSLTDLNSEKRIELREKNFFNEKKGVDYQPVILNGKIRGQTAESSKKILAQ